MVSVMIVPMASTVVNRMVNPIVAGLPEANAAVRSRRDEREGLRQVGDIRTDVHRIAEGERDVERAQEGKRVAEDGQVRIKPGKYRLEEGNVVQRG